MSTTTTITLQAGDTAAERLILSTAIDVAAPTLSTDGDPISCASALSTIGALSVPDSVRVRYAVTGGGSASLLLYLWDPLAEAWSLSRHAARVLVASGDGADITVPTQGATRLYVSVQGIAGGATATAWAASAAGAVDHRRPAGYPGAGVDGELYDAAAANTGASPALTDDGTFLCAGWDWAHFVFSAAAAAVTVRLWALDTSGVWAVLTSFGTSGSLAVQTGVPYRYTAAITGIDYAHVEIADINGTTLDASVCLSMEA